MDYRIVTGCGNSKQASDKDLQRIPAPFRAFRLSRGAVDGAECLVPDGSGMPTRHPCEVTTSAGAVLLERHLSKANFCTGLQLKHRACPIRFAGRFRCRHPWLHTADTFSSQLDRSRKFEEMLLNANQRLLVSALDEIVLGTLLCQMMYFLLRLPELLFPMLHLSSMNAQRLVSPQVVARHNTSHAFVSSSSKFWT